MPSPTKLAGLNQLGRQHRIAILAPVDADKKTMAHVGSAARGSTGEPVILAGSGVLHGPLDRLPTQGMCLCFLSMTTRCNAAKDGVRLTREHLEGALQPRLDPTFPK